jgi:Tripartite tricarboxylate transporter TctB family
MNMFVRRDAYAGGLFVLFGVFFTAESLNYEIGTAFRMGPGFMPLLLGCTLVALGVAVAMQSLRKVQSDSEEPTPIPWRGLALVLGTIIFFGLCLRGLGFVPVAIISAFATAMASQKNAPPFAALLALAMGAMCVLIFVVGLGLVVPLFGPWLGF